MRLPPDATARGSSRIAGIFSDSTSWRIQLVLVAAVAFAVYSNTFLNGFVDDDEAQVLRNPWIKDAHFLPTMFTSSVWSFLHGVGVNNYYRPLMHVIYFLNYHLFGFAAWGFHLVNVLFHAANTALVFLLTARLIGADVPSRVLAHRTASPPMRSAPFIAALLFATHPAHTEAVAWIASIPELSFTVLYLLSFYLYIDPRSRPGTRAFALAVICFFLALLCKETAVTLPALMLVYDCGVRRDERWRQDYVVRYAWYALAAGVYLTIRYHVLWQTLVPATQQWNLSSYQLVINVFPLFREYVGLLLVPTDLSFWHSFQPISSLLSGEGVLALAVVAAFVSAGLYAWKTDRVIVCCLSLFVLPLCPALVITALPMKPFAERYLYLPSAGLVIAAALLLARLAAVRAARIAVIAIVVSLAAAYSFATFSRNRVWESAYTLFSDTVSKSPDAPIPRYDLAINLAKLGRFDEAIAHYQILVNADPAYANAQSALGSALLQNGRFDEAIEHLNLALSLAPGSLETHNDLAIALRRKGDTRQAIEHYRKALAIDPDFADAHFNLGSVLADAGQMSEAMEHYRAAVRLRPESDYYRNLLGIEYGKLGLVDEAIEQFQEAVRLAPAEPAYGRNLDRALGLKHSGAASPYTEKHP